MQRLSLFTVVRVLLAAGICVMAPRAEAQFASPVKVLNAPDAPVPVKDTRMTTSTSATIQAGGTSAQVFPVIPSCPGGTEFLVTGAYAAPDFFGNNNILQLPAWGVRVNVVQKSSGGTVSRPILLYGNGPQHLSVTLPAGQPTFFDAAPDVIVQILSGQSPAQFTFVLHISGYCGLAFTTP